MKNHRLLSSELTAKLFPSYPRATLGDATRIVRRRFHLHSYTPGRGWAPNAAVPCIDIEGGRLYVHGVQIVGPRITRDQITWRQQARTPAGDHYSAGHIFLHSNGLEAHGRVSSGITARTAQHHDVLGTAILAVTYQTQVTQAKWPPETKPSSVPKSGWTSGLDLEISYRQEIGSSVPSPVVLLAGQDISQQCAWTVDDTHTILTIALSDSDCAFAPSLYAQARIAFDAYLLNAPGAGTVAKSCADTQAAGGNVWLWAARPVSAQHGRSLPQPARVALDASHLVAADPGLRVEDLMTILPDEQVNDDANSMLMRNMKWAMGQNDQERGWLNQFFTETPPVIAEADQRKLMEQSLDWYQNKFAMAYLTQSFNSYSGPNEPSHRLSTDQGARLTSFLKTGLAKDKDFNVQHQGIFVDAYIGAKSRLQDYVNDPSPGLVGWAQGAVVFTRTATAGDVTVPAGTGVQTASGITYTTQADTTLKAGKAASAPVAVAAVTSGPDGVVAAHTLTVLSQPVKGVDGVSNPAATTLTADVGGLKWAKSLFTALTSGTQFTLMVNRVAGASGDPKALGPLNNFACLLTALDRSGTVASNYFQSVISGVIVKLVPQVTHRDTDSIMQWLPAAMQELLRKLADGELPQETDISRAEAVAMYQEYLKHQSEIAIATAELLQSIVASGLIRQVEGAEARFASTIGARWPLLAKASRFMLALGWIGAVAGVVMSLVKGDWKKMTAIERAEFVTNIVQLACSAFDAVPLIWQGVKYVTLGIWNKLVEVWSSFRTQDQLQDAQEGIADEGTPLIRQEGEAMNEIIEAAEGGEALGEGTAWSRLFGESVLGGVLKCVGALAAAAMAGYSLWQLIEDVKNHGSVTTIVFDSLIFAANLLSAACLVLDLFVATSFLPIAGAVLAIAGIILGILAGFLEKPDNPVDDWMKDHGIPFAAGLPA